MNKFQIYACSKSSRQYDKVNIERQVACSTAHADHLHIENPRHSSTEDSKYQQLFEFVAEEKIILQTQLHQKNISTSFQCSVPIQKLR